MRAMGLAYQEPKPKAMSRPGPEILLTKANNRIKMTWASPLAVSPTLSITHLDPLPLTSSQSYDVWGITSELRVNGIASKKRFRKEIGRLRRNIRQRLFCGFFLKEEDGNDHGDDEVCEVQRRGSETDLSPTRENPNGQNEVGPQQLPQQP
ncbi:hypothetical protein CMV_007348 [Castanea mollissima]|uniref:Uncharacterized protein n=1 Tax=Castanea mollissima TaxID=60419 RepID=A0A8J4RP85_9ROSI|nr:hypothetical protein CMV_007348 [Castanea mollissima]